MNGSKKSGDGETNFGYSAENDFVIISPPALGTGDTATSALPKPVYRKGENRRMLKNVIVISFCFTLLFTAFNSMANLQSSLNSEVNSAKKKCAQASGLTGGKFQKYFNLLTFFAGRAWAL